MPRSLEFNAPSHDGRMPRLLGDDSGAILALGVCRRSGAARQPRQRPGWPATVRVMPCAFGFPSGSGGLGFVWFGSLGGLGFGGSLRHVQRQVHPFEDGALGGVTLALVEADDSGVAAVALFLRRGDLVEEDFHGVLLMKTRGGQAAVVEGAALAEGDHFLGDRAGGFGFGQRGGHAFVFDEAANQVGEHRISVWCSAGQLGGSLEVAHKGAVSDTCCPSWWSLLWALPGGPARRSCPGST